MPRRSKWALSKDIYGRKLEYPDAAKERDPDAPDREHLAWIRSLPCAVKAHPLPGATPCRFAVEAHHHTGGRGRGQKADDRRAFALCGHHHHAFHAATDEFRSMPKKERRAWQDRMLAETLSLLAKRDRGSAA